jgi:hypothetical protein
VQATRVYPPLHTQRELARTLASFCQHHYGKGAIEFLNMDEGDSECWRVWLRRSPALPQGNHALHIHTTTVYLVQTLRHIGRQREYGLLPCLEIACSRTLDMRVPIDEQLRQLLRTYGLKCARAGGRHLLCCEEVAASLRAQLSCCVHGDRLWAVRSIATRPETLVGRPEALILLHGRMLHLAVTWSVFFDQVLAYQQGELQLVLHLAEAAASTWVQAKSPGPLCVSTRALHALDHQMAQALSGAVGRGWKVHLKVAADAGATPPAALMAAGGQDELVVLVLSMASGKYKTVLYNPAVFDLLATTQPASSPSVGGWA